MSQPPYGGYPNAGDPGAHDPYGNQPQGYDPYGQQPQYPDTGWTPAPTQGGSGYQGIPDGYGQQPAYGAPNDPYGQQPQYGPPNDPYAQPAYGQPGYGAPAGPPPPGRNKQLPWIIVAVVALVGLATAVLIVVLNKDPSSERAGGSGTATPTPTSIAAPTTSAKTSSEPTSKSSSASASTNVTPAPTQTNLESQTNSMFKYISEQNKDELQKYVCGKDLDDFNSEWDKGTFQPFAGATFTITTSTADETGESSGTAALGVVKTDMAFSDGTTKPGSWPMSYRTDTSGKWFWYFCPTDQPDVDLNS